MAFISFTAEEIQPASNDEFQLIPTGWYPAIIVDSEMRQSKSGGEYLWLKFQIIDGQHNNRKVFTMLNVINQNEEVQKRSLERLSSICHATSRLSIQDTHELHDIPMEIKVGIRKGNDQYPDSNDIYAYRALGVEVKVQQHVAQQAFVPPWKK